MKLNKLIYVANAYSSKLKDPIQASKQRAERRTLEAYAGLKLKQLYDVTVILPIALSAAMADLGLLDTGFDQWASDDYTFINRCDEMWVLVSDGWDESYGVKSELEFAFRHGIPVKYINKDTFELTEQPPVYA